MQYKKIFTHYLRLIPLIRIANNLALDFAEYQHKMLNFLTWTTLFLLHRQLGQEKRTNEDLTRQVTELETRPPLSEFKILADDLDSEKTRVLDTQVGL